MAAAYDASWPYDCVVSWRRSSGGTVATDPAICCAPVLGGALAADDAEALAASFKALADPIRLRLLSIVAAAADGEVCVCDLPAMVDRSQPTVSHHLSVLVEAGLVEREQRGRWAWFRAVPSRIDALRDVLG
ncbi:MAG: ArsR family transcriptional regulator [Nonlabens sp.]|jgi:ArsR family transcriptional regulator